MNFLFQYTNVLDPASDPFPFMNYVDLEPVANSTKNVILGIDFSSVGHIYSIVLTLLVIFFMTIIAYTSVRMFEIRAREHHHMHHEMEEFAHKQKEREAKSQAQTFRNPRWAQVLEYLSSENEGDWRLAIIEADAMLEDLLTELGFQGENIGEKLKNANQDTFKDLASAWEVHAIRNRVAHEGASFPISSHEARRVISIYERIFYTYGFI